MLAPRLGHGGQRFRTLNIVDDFSRECLANEVDTSRPGARVVRVLDRLSEMRGRPKVIVLDNVLCWEGFVVNWPRVSARQFDVTVR